MKLYSQTRCVRDVEKGKGGGGESEVVLGGERVSWETDEGQNQLHEEQATVES